MKSLFHFSCSMSVIFFLVLSEARAVVTIAIDQTLQAGDPPSNTDNQDPIEITDGDFAIRVQGIGGNGTGSSDSNATDGISMGSIGEFNNEEGADLTVTQTAAVTDRIYGIILSIQGGAGGDATNDDASYNAGVGGSVGDIGSTEALNSATVMLNPATYSGGFTVWSAFLAGGDGGSVTPSSYNSDNVPQFKDGGIAGQGGSTGEISLTNDGDLLVGASDSPAVVSGANYGIHARTQGGRPGTGSVGLEGANGGNISIENSGAIRLYAGGSGQYELYGIVAEAYGSGGSASYTSGMNGGAGANGGTVSVSLSLGGDIYLDGTGAGSDSPAWGAGISVLSQGGNGGQGYDSSYGGAGGESGQVSVAVTDASVTTVGYGLMGISVSGVGGNGGDGGVQQDSSDAGNGGSAGGASSVTLTSNDSSSTTGVSTSGNSAGAILVSSQGGIGGTGTEYDNSVLGAGRAGNGGTGGNAQDASVTLGGSASSIFVTTEGDSSVGIRVQSIGGAGGHGGKIEGNGSVSSKGSAGGSGGYAGEVEATIGESIGAQIQTQGTESHGIILLSQGGSAGDAGDIDTLISNAGQNGGTGGAGEEIRFTFGNGSKIQTNGDQSIGVGIQSVGADGGAGADIDEGGGSSAGNGGNGGASGDLSIVTGQGSKILTTGDESHGLIARTLSGAGGGGGNASDDGVAGEGGDAGNGGDTGDVDAALSGTMITKGDFSLGVLFQSMTGAGGDAGGDRSVFYGSGGNGGNAGNLGTISVDADTNSEITTFGNGSHALVIQSIAGGGGAAGDGDGAVGLGGDSSAGGNGGTINVSGVGSIATFGENAIGVLSQSIAGGGGSGGSSSGVITIGSDGAVGGNGGETTVSLTDAGEVLLTYGQLSHGIVNQSIGGGGGNAGNATSVGPEVSVAIGGSGGAGGDGGIAEVFINSDLEIITAGSNSIGIVNQSIAGGGGTGGSAYTHSVGAGFDTSVAVGGQGGSGGEGSVSEVGLSGGGVFTGALTGHTSDPSSANPVDAFGIVAQSIGGGGGAGGSATAQALAIAVPVPETDTSFAVSVTSAAGGRGGIGGSGGEAIGYLDEGSRVATQGQGSHGVVVQSIGGGGGLGGDSSASASTVAASGDAENTVEVTGNFTVGGEGGGAGNGGTVGVYVGGNPNAVADGAASVTTFGDYSNAVLAQSIGGGGGNAGFGSGNTRNRGGTESLGMTIDIGASGGAGGEGGRVTVQVFDEGTVQTYGAGSHGIVAQSIGGGGGTSQGGGLSFGAAASVAGEDDGSSDDDDLDLDGIISISLGKDGGAGSDGGVVSVTNQGSITTWGGDSVGILAQSIGGGGGIGGSAGNDASADNPIDPSTGERFYSSSGGDDSSSDGSTVSAKFTLDVGGGGGSAANGGDVTITNSGQIQTYGDWSSGILAQSIGGGGGKGGTAVSANTEANPTLSIDVGVGGAGGDGGDGGSVTIDLDSGSSIMTSGYGAFGIHAQSIGGGGGIGADGSMTGTGTIQVGGDVSGSGGNFGDSGGVTLSGDAIVTTTGDAAHAIVLQSIGGGGGVGGQGSSLDLATGSPDPSISLSVGGGQDSEGVAGAVQLNGTVNISTTGWASYGILAQSIGGGGGLAWTPEEGQDLEVNPIQVGGNGSLGDSGGVSITLSAGSTIYTTGLAAHGIVAQAIGGGGGIAGYPSSDGAVYYSDGIDFDGVAPSGTAEYPVTISVDGIIQTTGDGAHGIFAQSIGGGGGFRGYESSVDMGTVSAPGSSSSLGGEISITQSGTISASGYNSVGILAQQAAPSESGSTVEITINGSVTGGSGDGGSETDGSGGGYGVWIIANTSGESTLTINSGGSLSAASGNAARFDNSGSGPGVLYNYGDVSGSVVGFTDSSGAEAVQVNNYSTGRFFTGSRVEANVYNEGQIFVGRGIPGGGYGQTVITGDFVQASGGTLIFRTDFERGQNDSLVVEGDAELNGRVRPQPVPGARIVPYRRLTLLTVDGEISGRLYLDGSLGGIFNYDLRQSANTYTIAVTGIDLAGLDPTFSENQLMMAEYLEEIFLAGSGGLDIFGTLDALSRTQAGQIGTFFDELTPGATLGFGAFGSTEAQYFSDSVLNGPIFEGSTATLAESPSAWIRAHGRITSQRFPDGYSNYDIDSMMYQTGGQAAIADNTYLGGSIAYRDDSLRSDNHITSGSGDTALGAVTLKHETGPWLLEGALSGSLGWYETSRQINFPGEEAVAEASPQVQTAALAFRVAYLHAYEKVYLRPLVTMTGVYTHSSSYTESGAGAFDLSVDSAEESTLFFTPAFEVGARTDFSNDTIMRSFVRPGVVFASNDSWEQDARFVGSPESVGDFTTRLPLDDISGTVVAGIDFQFNESSSAHIRYEGRFSENVSSNGGSIGLKITF